MNAKTKKIMMFLIVVGFLLAACGGGNDAAATTPPPTETPAPSTATLPATHKSETASVPAISDEGGGAGDEGGGRGVPQNLSPFEIGGNPANDPEAGGFGDPNATFPLPPVCAGYDPDLNPGCVPPCNENCGD